MPPATAARRTVLVTGASSGIGRAAAHRLAAAGHEVFGTSRRARPDDPGEHGVRMTTMDVRSDESVRRCVDEVTERAGGIDVLVNNAGVMHHGFAEETSRAEADAVFETNFFGAVRVIDAVLPAMRERRGGRIVNVGSLAAWVGEPGEAFYSASKAALARYTEALRHEVWHLGISVCLVEPGAFRTNVVAAATTGARRIADYDGPRESAHATFERAAGGGADPRRAADLLVDVVAADWPRSRYGAGWDGRWLPKVKAFLPQRLADNLLRRGFGLPPAVREP